MKNYFLFLVAIFTTTLQASEIQLTFNCSCKTTEFSTNPSLLCTPKLKSQKGDEYVMSQPIRYNFGKLEGCQNSLRGLGLFDNQIFVSPENGGNETQYLLNLELVRPYKESCNLSKIADGVEYWKCALETALAIRPVGSETVVSGKTVVVSNSEPVGFLGARQPEWSAGLALLKIEVLTEEFSKKTALFTLLTH